jgi:DNA-binding LytR/AlgR family response regulator
MADDRELATPPGELSLDQLHAIDAAPTIRRIGVRTGTGTVIVDGGDIDWVEAVGDYARIHAGTRTHLVSQRMHVLETVLGHTRSALGIQEFQ